MDQGYVRLEIVAGCEGLNDLMMVCEQKNLYCKEYILHMET